jgi:hypothetical protein
MWFFIGSRYLRGGEGCGFLPATFGNVISILVQSDMRMTTWTFKSLDFGSALSSVSVLAPRLLHSQRALVRAVSIEAT